MACNMVCDHFNRSDKKPILLLIKGTAGSGKSYLIDAIRNVLQTKCKVLAYTGKGFFNANGVTLHSFLKLPIVTKRLVELKGIALQQLQSSLENVRYPIIDDSPSQLLMSLGDPVRLREQACFQCMNLLVKIRRVVE